MKGLNYKLRGLKHLDLYSFKTNTFIRVSGKITKEMVVGFSSGRMGPSTKVTGETT